MNFQIIRKLAIFFLALSLYSCASVRSPTGGDKDEIPPVLITSVPLNYSTSFNQRKITLFFNEEIQINNIQKELTITPKTTIPYIATPKGKKLTIEFEKNLETNTTYTFNFRKAIGDLNENNPPKQLKLVFSTGSYLDSAKLLINVFDALAGKPMENGIATLYLNSDTVNPAKQAPYYFTTIENGKAIFEYIKNGNYQLYTITDKNDNLQYDPTTSERIGWKDTVVEAGKVLDHQITLSKEESIPLQIIDRTAYKNSFSYEYNRIPKKLILPVRKGYYFIQTKKEVSIYRLNNPIIDSLTFTVTSLDSANNSRLDAITPNFSGKKENPRTEEPIYNTYPKKGGQLKPTDSIRIQVKDSITYWNNSGFSIRYDTNKTEPANPTVRNQTIAIPFKIAKTVKLYIGKGAVKTIIGDTNTADTLGFTYLTTENLGSIGYILKSPPKETYYVELLNEAGELINAYKSKSRGSFTNLLPGNYRIRYFIDTNKDESWTVGSLKLKKQAEPLYTYKDIIPVKANWEVNDITW